MCVCGYKHCGIFKRCYISFYLKEVDIFDRIVLVGPGWGIYLQHMVGKGCVSYMMG